MRCKFAFIASAVILTGFGTLACDTTVEPILGSDQPYSVYGLLDPTADTQAVRVYRLNSRLDTTDFTNLKASVTSTNLTTGRRRQWNDSISRIETGDLRRVYWAPFRADYGHRYRIAVHSPDGDSTWATVRIPPETESKFSPADTGRAGLQATITGAQGVPSVINPRLTYIAANVPPPPDPRTPPEPQIVETLRVEMGGRLQKRGTGFRFRWDVRQHYLEIFRNMSEIDTIRNVQIDLSVIVLRTIQIRYMVANELWSQNVVGLPDRELAKPDVLSNVNNGLGFVGAGYVVNRSYLPPRDLREKAGFDLCRPPFC